ncbi:MAG: tyrosine--tRNA ligase [Paracoccus sp. (in: a-proteobacteria)]|nr:tyrosine--tRNA ligase [Paracoccus sp. (in: a-proteobacteria)]
MAPTPKSEFLNIIMERGFLADCTDLQALDDTLTQGPVTAYIGYDATAASLHVGHLLNIMLLRWFQKTGNRPVTLMGGGTTKVGDPSFRSDERPLLDDAAIAANIDGMQRVFARYLDYGDGGAQMLNNADWLVGLNYLDFLRDIGRHFSVNRMLSFESVKSRLDREQSLSFLEFNYMILQAYDFMELYRRHGVTLQMGGSDQWGNIVNGIDLTRRVLDREVWGLTTPLLTTSDGRKMGKSAGGATWLNAEMLSPYEFWQFWRNTTDADVGRFLKLYTELPVGECDRLGALSGAEINEAKVILANHVTTLLHGADAAASAEATAREVFEQGGAGGDLEVVTISAAALPLPVAQLLVQTGITASGKEAKRLIAEGGLRLNNDVAHDPQTVVDAVLIGDGLKISVGKKKHRMLRIG